MRAIGLGLGLPFAGRAGAGGGGGGADPTLALDLGFTTGVLDSKVTFTRTTAATHINSSGVIASAAINAARFDHDPVSLAARGLLIEEQRTNVCINSENLAAWIVQSGNVTITANDAVAPDGNMTADKVAANATATNAGAYQNLSGTSGTNAMTIYVKKGVGDWCRILTWDGGYAYTWFNLATATVGTDNNGGLGFIEPAGGGYFRIGIRRTHSGDASYGLGVTNGDNTDACTAGDYIHAWGAQRELGSFATSYIPTGAAAVTRAADVALMTGTNFSSWWNASAGTLIAQFDGPASGTRPVVAVDDNTANEVIRLYGSGTDPKAIVTDGGATQADLDAGTLTANISGKLGLAFAAADFAACFNGGTVAVDTAGTLPTVTQARLGADVAGNYLSGHLARLQFYNVAKSDADLVTLTT